MNLAADDGWLVSPAGGGTADSSYFDANRNVIKVNTGDTVSRAILRPTATYSGKSVDVVCKWDGSGTVTPFMQATNVNLTWTSTNSFRFTVLPNSIAASIAYLKAVDPNNPVRNFDCREADADPNALFDPAYLAMVKRFTTARFMQWQGVNNNPPSITWAARTTPAMGQIKGTDGYAIEYMIALANQAHVNPWFCMPWNADDDYIRRFATMVRDQLDPSLTAYVELSNEVWNYFMPVTIQAQNEAQAENLSSNIYLGTILRYAEKHGHVMDIWSDVFQGQTSRIVRVLSGQNGGGGLQQIMPYRDTATKVDALASAPYFGYDITSYTGPTNDLSSMFADIKASVDQNIDYAKNVKTLADQYGKRYVSYEGGQGVTGNAATVALLSQVQHDPRMGQLMSYYMTRWANEIGDNLNLFDDIDQVSNYGAWGLLDYVGESPVGTPKSKAVFLMQQSIGK